MSSDLLSQEDIDNLIPAVASGAAGGGSVNADQIKPVVSMMSEQMSTVLLTVLGKEITVMIENAGPADEGKLSERFSAGAVILKVELSNRVNGPFYYVYAKNDVALLADLMMMGDGSAAYEEDHKDAISELTNQIMGAVTSTFGTTFDAQVTAGGATIEDYSPTAGGLNLAECVQFSMAMKVEEIRTVQFSVLVPNGTVASLAGLSSKGGKGDTKGSSSDSGFDFSDVGSVDMGGGAPLQNFSQPGGSLATDRSAQFTSTGNPQIDMLLDVTLQVSIELGRTDMSIKKILELGPGAIIELNRMAGEPVDLLVNDKVIAKGEVVVVDENFGIRVVKLVSPEERLKNLK